MSSPTRILSDVHFGHPASYVRDLRQLDPLLEGVSRVIFNGDTVEMRFLDEREKALADAEAVREWCLGAGVEPLFVTGNHDPFLGDIHHVDLAGGSVLVTHGDILFHGVSPWSRESWRLHDAHTREIAALEDPANFEDQLRAAKRTMLAVEHLGPKMRHAKRQAPTLSSFFHEIWPPWRPLRIVGCWMRTPAQAGAMVARYRPEARFVVIGHMHWAGVWRLKNRVVVNTGSFLPFSQRLAVDVDTESGELIVRKIVGKRMSFRLGAEMARFQIPGPVAEFVGSGT